MKSVIGLLVISMSLLLWSCGANGLIGDCTSAAVLNQELAGETKKLSTALTNFGAVQSDTNCDDVISAYKAYIGALKDFQDCANELGVGSEFRRSLSEAEDNLGDFECE